MTDQAVRPAADHIDLADARRRIKAIFIGSVGNLVEWYDFYAYTAFALYFAPAFFPAQRPRRAAAQRRDPVRARLHRAAARRLAVRPSRRPLRPARLSLTLSVLLMCFGSLIIAVTPTYATIGIAAPAMLALARIIQGLSLGGEYGASATYLSEVADREASRLLFELPVRHADRRPAHRDSGAAAAAEGVPHAGAAEGLGLAHSVRDRRAARGLRRC